MKAQCRCGKILIIPNDQMGQRGICPRCGNRMVIPVLAGATVVPPTGSAPIPLPPKENEPPASHPEEKKPEPPAPPSPPPAGAGETRERLREVKPCPFCGEEILTIAVKCKHCGEWLGEEKRAEMAAKISPAPTPEEPKKPAEVPYVEMTPLSPVPPPPAPVSAQPRQRTLLPTRPCPSCRKEILSVATLCRHCGSPTELRARPMRNPYFAIHATAMFFALVATIGVIFPMTDLKDAKSFFDERRPEAGVIVAAAGLLIVFGAILSAARKFFTPAYLIGGLAMIGIGVLQCLHFMEVREKTKDVQVGPAVYIISAAGVLILLCGIVGFFKKRSLTPRKKETPSEDSTPS